MTSFASRRAAPVPAPVVVDRSIGSLAVRWSLFRAGAAEMLEVAIDDHLAGATLIGADGERQTLVQGVPVRVELAGMLEHVEVADVVSMTLRRSVDGRVDVLYARTPLLEAIGVAGGCIERPELGAR